MNKCPRCFSDLHDDQYSWSVSPLAGGQRYIDPVASAFAGADTESGPIYSVTRPPGFRGPLLSVEDEGDRQTALAEWHRADKVLAATALRPVSPTGVLS